MLGFNMGKNGHTKYQIELIVLEISWSVILDIFELNIGNIGRILLDHFLIYICTNNIYALWHECRYMPDDPGYTATPF